MQLKVFLLIGFVLNAFCLNNLSGGFLSPKYDFPKNESLVESLKKSSFAELFIKADPQKTDEIIFLLEDLIAEASAALDILRSHVTDATNSLNTANDNVQTANDNVQTCYDGVQTALYNIHAAQVALDLADTDHSNAVIDQTNAVNDQQEAQSRKDLVDQNYAEQSPALIDELEVLQQVIDSLGGLKACTIEDTSACVQGDVALYQPQQQNGYISGLLLIWYNNAWGTVCDDVTDCDDPNGGGLSNCGNGNVNKAGGVNLAQVACRALGFTGGEEFNADGTTSGYPIVVDGTENHITGCAGDENRLSDCQWIAFGSHNCVHSEDVGVQCEG